MDGKTSGKKKFKISIYNYLKWSIFKASVIIISNSRERNILQNWGYNSDVYSEPTVVSPQKVNKVKPEEIKKICVPSG